MLGPVQKAEAQERPVELHCDSTRSSSASSRWQQFYALPYDRWEGYGAERSEMLNFIRNNGIDNVEFLTTDNHATLQNQVSIDRFT